MTKEELLIQMNILPSNLKIYLVRYSFDKEHCEQWLVDGEYRIFTETQQAMKFKMLHKNTVIIPYTVHELIDIIKNDEN